jgi:hypothetical protein
MVAGAEGLGLPLAEHVAFVLGALCEVAGELGLEGSTPTAERV